MSRKRNSIFNPPRGVEVSAGDMVMLDRLNNAYEEDVKAGIMGDVVVEPEIIMPGPTVDGFIEFATDVPQIIDFVKSDVAPVVSDTISFAADQVAMVENKVLPSTGTTITSLGVIAFMAALGLIVAAKHL